MVDAGRPRVRCRDAGAEPAGRDRRRDRRLLRRDVRRPIFLPDVVKYLPFQLADTALGTPAFGGGPPVTGDLTADTALLLLLVWLAGTLAVASGFTERAEITG